MKVIIRFIEEELEDETFDSILPIGTTVRAHEADSDWYVIKVVAILETKEIIMFVSRKNKI